MCSVQFSCSVVSNSLQPHGLQHTRLPCPSSTPRSPVSWPGESHGLYSSAAAAAAKSFHSCPTLCDPIDGSPQGSSLGFSRQERWSGLPFPSPMHESESEVTHSVQLLVTPWPTAYQAPPSKGFSRQQYWSGVHCLLPQL